MQFGDAVTAMRNGLKVFRPPWDQRRAVQPGAFLMIGEVPDPEAQGGRREAIIHCVGVGAMTSSRYVDGGIVSDADLLADDWEIRQS
jgi:hypothetical protein